jgi:hypothetical protein
VKAKEKRAPAWGLGLWALVIFLTGCEGTQRSFPQSLRGDGGPDGNNVEDAGAAGSGSPEDGGAAGQATEDDDALLGLGDVCTEASDCESRECVDGVCCNSPCEELCATCAAPGNEGACSPAPSDVACAPLSCPAVTECRGRDGTALALNCEGIGACRESVACAPLNAAAGTSCQNGAGSCNGDGACVVPGKASLGESCSANDECGEGHCVLGATGVGTCCDAACVGTCQQCSTDGHCEEAPPTDATCEPVTCPPDNPCFDHADTLTENLCRGFGQCRTAQSCVGTALRPASNCDCDAEGSCALRPGVGCTGAAECSRGVCAATVGNGSVCCAVACAAGLSCRSDGQGCVECDEGRIECEDGVEVRCSVGERIPETCAYGCTRGVGCNERAPVGFSCTTAQCVSGAICQDDVGGAPRCCSRDCAAEGKQCATDGSCVCPEGQTPEADDECLLQAGDPCGAGQCGTGLVCVDGVCCNEACDGSCESCNQPGTAGTCAFDAQDTTSCGTGKRCVARDDCRGQPGEDCAETRDCVSGNCESLVGVSGATQCCADNCASGTPFCSSDGSRCVQCESDADCANGCNAQTGRCNALRAPGDLCSVAAQCTNAGCLPASDNPQTNRCCANCAPGQLCTAQGQCQDPPASAGNECTSDAQCDSGLFCRDGVCCSSRCDGACQSCGSGGLCNVTPTSDSACPPLQCGASTECRIVTAPAAAACSALGQCAQCQTRNQPVGTDCGTDSDCDASGTCRPNTTPPTVVASSLRPGAFIDFDRINLIFTPATDDRTPANQLEYAAFHAATNTFPSGAAQIVSAATSGSLSTLRPFAVGAQLEGLVLPQRSRQHFVVVVVRDRSGNVATYTPTQVTFQDPPSCTLPGDCIDQQCLTLFADNDGDCRGDPNTTIRRCVAPALSRNGCEPPTADITGFAGVTVGTARFVNNSLDCLDANRDVYRNQPDFFDTPFVVPAGSPPGAFVNGFDYNCSGAPEQLFASVTTVPECPPPVNDACAPDQTYYVDGASPVACGTQTGAVGGCGESRFQDGTLRACQRGGVPATKNCH